MSVFGTGVAAGVAQTAHNAQQVARERDRKVRDRADAERAERQSFQLHLSSTGETRDADDELPDKPPPMYERLWEGDAEAQADEAEHHGEQPPEPPKPDLNQLHLYTPNHLPPTPPLYRHLDIQA